MNKHPLHYDSLDTTLICIFPKSRFKGTLSSSQRRQRRKHKKVQQQPLTKRERVALSPTVNAEKTVIWSKKSLLSIIQEKIVPSHLNTMDKMTSYMEEQFISAQNYTRSLIMPSYLARTNPNRRIGPDMDSKWWWFYNIILALLPATFIALVCEYYTEEMEEFLSQQNEMEKRRLMGDDFVNQYNIIDDKNSKNTSIIDRVLESVFVLSGYQQPQELKNNKQQSSSNVSIEKQNNDHTAKSKTTVIDETLQTQNDNSQSKTASSKNKTSDNKNEISKDVDVSELLRRIEVLEQKLVVAANTKANKETLSPSPNNLQRSQQSGIRSRRDDKMIKNWLRETDDQVKQQQQQQQERNNDEVEKGNNITLYHLYQQADSKVLSFWNKYIIGKEKEPVMIVNDDDGSANKIVDNNDNNNNKEKKRIENDSTMKEIQEKSELHTPSSINNIHQNHDNKVTELSEQDSSWSNNEKKKKDGWRFWKDNVIHLYRREKPSSIQDENSQITPSTDEE